MINTKQPNIAAQLREKFEEAEIYFARNKRFSLEVSDRMYKIFLCLFIQIVSSLYR